MGIVNEAIYEVYFRMLFRLVVENKFVESHAEIDFFAKKKTEK